MSDATTGQVQDAYADLVSIAQAAKDVRKARKAVRDFALSRGIAIQDGKRIKVPLSELRRLLASQKVPKTVHPLVKC